MMKLYQFLVIFFCAICLNAQNSVTFYAGAGFRPQSSEVENKQFLNDESGFHLGLFLPFVSKSNFSFGLNLSGEYFAASKNSYDEYFVYDLYNANYSVNKDAYSKSWEKLFLSGIGPQFNFNFGERFSISPIVTFGYAYFSQNEFWILENVEYESGGHPANFTKDIFYQEKVKNGSFFLTPRIRFTYGFSDHFSFWAEGNMRFYNYKTRQTIWIPYETPPLQNGEYSWTQLAEGHYETNEETFNQNSFGINFGLAYHFGRKKDKKDKDWDEAVGDLKERETSTETNCEKTKLSKKNQYKTYFIKKGEYPVFEWENNDENVTGYEVNIYKAKNALNTQKNAIGGNKPIFEKDSGNWIRTNKPFFEKDSLNWLKANKPFFEKETLRLEIKTNKPFFEKDSPIWYFRTKNKILKSDKKLQKIFEKIPPNKVQDYAWTVTTYYKDCPPQTSEPGHVKMSQNRIGIDVTKIECDGYTTDGKTKYIVNYDLEALTGNANNWIVNSISILDDSNGSTIQVFPFSPALNLPPNTTQSHTLNIEVPVGIQNITVQADGTLGAGSGDASSSVELPSCVCKTCDEWEINSRNESLREVTALPVSNFATLLLSGMIQVQNADPMQSVKAEIVSVQTSTADPACKISSCVNQSSQMGLISNWPGTGLGPNNAVWTRTLKDDNNDGYTNIVVWTANASTGVSLNNYVPVRLYINLPLSSLDCCETTIHICVRYTFTDINCNTCDYLVCYDYEAETDNDGGGDGPFDPTDTPNLGGIK